MSMYAQFLSIALEQASQSDGRPPRAELWVDCCSAVTDWTASEARVTGRVGLLTPCQESWSTTWP